MKCYSFLPSILQFSMLGNFSRTITTQYCIKPGAYKLSAMKELCPGFLIRIDGELCPHIKGKVNSRSVRHYNKQNNLMCNNVFDSIYMYTPCIHRACHFAELMIALYIEVERTIALGSMIISLCVPLHVSSTIFVKNYYVLIIVSSWSQKLVHKNQYMHS